MAVGDLVIISTDCLQSKHTFKIGELEEDEVDDNELKIPLLEEEDDVEELVVSPPCIDLGRSYLPRVLDLLTLVLKIKIRNQYFLSFFQSNNLKLYIILYLEGF